MSNEQANRPPNTLSGADVVCFASITDLHPSGGTTHRVNGEVRQAFAHLAIVKYPDDGSHYLFYCDLAWGVVTDTWQATIDDAMHQAEHEYPGVSELWIDYSSLN